MQKICEWKYCGKEFKAKRKDTRYCYEQHENKCGNCENMYAIKNMKVPGKSCSKMCADKLTQSQTLLNGVEKECAYCHSVFLSLKSSDIYCKKKHYAKCVVCNNEFVLLSMTRIAKTCSKKCAAKITDFSARNKKSEETLLSEYGVKNASQIQSVKDKKKRTTFVNHGVFNIFQRDDIKYKAQQNNGFTISKENLRWQEKLEREIGVFFELEKKIPNTNLYFDLKYENLFIDINPTFTHNSTFSFPHKTGRCKIVNCSKKSHQPKAETYHQQRALEAEKNGYTLLQYFDWYDEDIFLSIVKSKLKMSAHKIYAKKTILKEISQRDANKFLKENHLMGSSNGQELCLGLFVRNSTVSASGLLSGSSEAIAEELTLVHVQTYGKARMSKNHEWEAIRSCSKLDWVIPGGFSKCDKYFFNKVQPESVVSYVDLSISQGDTDTKFDGWEVEKTNRPNATWVYTLFNENNDKPIFVKDSSVRRVSADRILGFEIGDKYPKHHEDGSKVSNDFVMLSEGYVKVYDAGVRRIGWMR